MSIGENGIVTLDNCLISYAATCNMLLAESHGPDKNIRLTDSGNLASTRSTIPPDLETAAIIESCALSYELPPLIENMSIRGSGNVTLSN